jgi:putative restriction endonuclease
MFVDPDLATRLSPDHRRRLEWFEEHAGEVIPRPERLEGRLPLVHPRMGIYKPRELEYATAIVTRLRSRYHGDSVTHHADGTWNMVYHQQDTPVGRDDGAWANDALRACLRDGIPVGVLEERQTPERPRLFEVLGLGALAGWQSDYFILQSLSHAAAGPGRSAINALLATAEALEAAQNEEQPLPADDYDARLRTMRQIVARRGQGAFRAALLDAYAGRCAVTGCDVPEVLEAAHLRPYRGPGSHDVRNGLLLRADIHTLLDLLLVAFNPATRTLAVSSQLEGTQYEQLSGRSLAEPRLLRQRPAAAILEDLWRDFISQRVRPGPARFGTRANGA